jgi:hypothetical protein
MYSYYEWSYDAEVAAVMARRVTLNSGFFAMAADNPIWLEWEAEVRRLYLEHDKSDQTTARHLAEQIALNVVAARGHGVSMIDPIYNYVCLWNPPFRDAADEFPRLRKQLWEQRPARL